jgi:hypothetical protein
MLGVPGSGGQAGIQQPLRPAESCQMPVGETGVRREQLTREPPQSIGQIGRDGISVLEFDRNGAD